VGARRSVRPVIVELVRSRMIVQTKKLAWLLDGLVDESTRGRQTVVIDGHQIAKKISVPVANAVEGLVRDGAVRVVFRAGYGPCLVAGPSFSNATQTTTTENR